MTPIVRLVVLTAAAVSLANGPLITGAPASNLDLVRIETFDFAFRAPTTVRAGFNRVRLVNRGKSVHNVELTKVADTASVDFLYKLITSTVVNVTVKDWGGPSNTAPRDSTEVVVELKPGRYLVSCWVTGVDGKPHATKGMLSLIDVKRAAGPGAAAVNSIEPKADLVLRTADYKFNFSAPLTRGAHLVRFENDGPQEHDIQIVKLHPDGSMKKILKWAADGLIGAPPSSDLMGGSVGIDPHSRVWFPLDLVPGRYAMFCFVPDRKDGKPHILHGMWKELTVR